MGFGRELVDTVLGRGRGRSRGFARGDLRHPPGSNGVDDPRRVGRRDEQPRCSRRWTRTFAHWKDVSRWGPPRGPGTPPRPEGTPSAPASFGKSRGGGRGDGRRRKRASTDPAPPPLPPLVRAVLQCGSGWTVHHPFSLEPDPGSIPSLVRSNPDRVPWRGTRSTVSQQAHARPRLRRTRTRFRR